MKKIPLRKCIISKDILPKNDLIRIVVTKEKQIFIDNTGKRNGRGYYLKKDKGIIEKVIKNKLLDKILRKEIKPEIYEELKNALV